MAIRYVISRYASVRWVDGRILVSSATSGATLETSDLGLVRLVHAFATPFSIAEVVAFLEQGVPPLLEARIHDLILSGILVRADRPEPEATLGWDPASLAFHRASRVTTGRGGGRPSADAAASGARVLLPEDRGWLGGGVVSALEKRRSRRAWAKTPVSLETLSRLLSVTARDRKPSSDPTAEPSRSYPSGGGIHSLLLYLVAGAQAVEGMSPGLYRYHSSKHELEPCPGDAAAVAELLNIAAKGLEATPPPLLLVVTSRIGRSSAKYGRVAYRLVLTEVGGLYQSLYLAAEEMGLAGCALGGCETAARFARISGLQDIVEPVVGEFAVGPRVAQ
jgi:SagB-type dehydrogenase family enzyme